MFSAHDPVIRLRDRVPIRQNRYVRVEIRRRQKRVYSLEVLLLLGGREVGGEVGGLAGR